MNLLKQSINCGFISPEIDPQVFQDFKERITDNRYFDFLSEVSNGGFFFGGSLHIYGLCQSPSYHNLNYVNQIIKREYGELASGNTCFGQDILGNQFAFTLSGIVFLNIETAESEFLANTFDEWLKVLETDLDFLTGKGFLRQWVERNPMIDFDQRLCPKIPFVIGGEYTVENFYPQYFPTYLSSNSNIAKQMRDNPDGTRVKIKVAK